MFQCERCAHEFDDSMDLRRHSKQNTCSLNTIRSNAPRLPAILPIFASPSALTSPDSRNIAQPLPITPCPALAQIATTSPGLFPQALPITPSPALAQIATTSSGVLPQPDDDEGSKVVLLIYLLFTQTQFS